ncbi:hypothetical protein GCM10011344_40970 [Dokdonia pacifica]|nr:hypothetical protein GCM10011344_40970 [Dokdonia pacifica]
MEISNMNLDEVDLLVLSACETALGEIKGSDGVYGLQRSFKIAGVKYVIVSLWKVPDNESKEFMTTFYKLLFQGELIELAFNETKNIMSKKYDPYYWSAFVLTR